ncbi:hypothetical protein AB5N19_02158 [Seiridium cardinale]|uniref:Uncharacterized protein n=1 Tax=Seiridium cardinale TaxID=138064 RepID=A0ABR2XMX5_9PEZI
MNLYGIPAIKRRREEEDNAYGRRLITPESSIDEAVQTPTPLNKRYRAHAKQNEDDFENAESLDEAMADSSKSLALTISHDEMISRLDIKTLRDIVTFMAAESSDARALVKLAYLQNNQKTDLRRYALEVDQLFGSQSERHAVSGTAYSDVKSSIDKLANHVGPHSSYSTKKSALEALQDITFSILRADPSRQAIEVKEQFETDDCIPLLMLQIVRSMPSEERIRVSLEATVHGSTFVKALRYRHEKAIENYVAGFYDLSLVLESLSQSAGDF